MNNAEMVTASKILTMDIHQIRLTNLRYWDEKLGRKLLAEKAGYSDTNYLNQLVGHHENIGSRTARRLEKGLNLEKGWFDLPHYKHWGDEEPDSGVREQANSEYVTVPFKSVKLRATNESADGFEIQFSDDEDLKPLFYRRDWIEKNGYQVHLLAVRTVSGSSMEPALHDGDTVLVNMGSKRPKHGIVFEVLIEGVPSIKRLNKRSGEWWITSDNPTHQKTDLPMENESQIIGEIVERRSSHI